MHILRARGAAALLALAAMASSAATATAQEAPPVFTGEVEVTLVTLSVTVVDRDGQPALELGPEQFRVRHDGQPVEIVHFTRFGRDGVETLPTGGEAAAPGVAATAAQPASLVVLFDNPSLQRRARKRVVEALGPFLQQRTAAGDRVLVAVADDRLQILQPFTSDGRQVAAALERVLERDAGGDATRSTRRLLRREIASAEMVSAHVEPFTSGSSGGARPGGAGGSGGSGGPGSGGGGGPGTSGSSSAPQISNRSDLGSSRAQMLLMQIEGLRQQEVQRIVGSLAVLHEAVRGLAGVPGRSDVLWVGEDLALRPTVDVYRWLYGKFSRQADRLNLDIPELWGTRFDLEPQFRILAASAQAAGAGIHLVDVAEREREGGGADIGAPRTDSFTASDPAGAGLTRGTDMSRMGETAEGARYLANTSGGSFYGNSREYDRFFGELGQVLGSYYVLGYQLPEPADGRLHEVEVQVTRPGLEVRHHERVPVPTPEQRLADLALSRLLLEAGPDPLDLRLQAGPAEAAEGGTVQTVVVDLPLERLLLADDEGARVGVLQVAVAATGAAATAVRFLELPLRVPVGSSAERLRSAFRLMMEPGTSELAVAVRDAGSGTVGSALLRLEAAGGGAAPH